MKSKLYGLVFWKYIMKKQNNKFKNYNYNNKNIKFIKIRRYEK